MKKTLFGFLVLALISVLAISVFAATYTDISGHWAENAIERWTDEGIVKGYEDNTFRPDNLLTRAEYATILIRMFEAEKTVDLSSYKDVEKNAWYYDALSKAVAMGAMQGYSSTEMGPNANITRQEAMVSLNRILEVKALKPTSGDIDITYIDEDAIASWAVNAIKLFTKNGYVNGYEDGTVRPTNNITRAEVAKLLDKAISRIIRKTGEYDMTGVDGSIIVLANNVTLKNANLEKVFALNDEVKKTLKVENVDDKDIIVINPDGKKPSSGGGGGSSTPAKKTYTITLTESGDRYDVKAEGTVADGVYVTVIVDGKTVLKDIQFTSDAEKFASTKIDLIGKINDLRKEVNDEKLVRTAYEDFYPNEEVIAFIKEAIAKADLTQEEKDYIKASRDAYINGEMTAKELYATFTPEYKAKARAYFESDKVDYAVALKAFQLFDAIEK